MTIPCRHRFYDTLIPNQDKVKFLFVGTFNPNWNAIDGNNADYFYGRKTNLFWCICPHAFNDNCLIDKGLNEWLLFCNQNQIGLTDIIKEVTNANPQIERHIKLLTSGFQDKNLDLKEDNKFFFNLEFNTVNINDFITTRQNELKGVFFTRKSHSDIPRIWRHWLTIKQHCDDLNIYNASLPTPSIRGGAIRDKIFNWRQEIQNCM